MLAVRAVVLLTVIELTVMPLPKLTVVVVCEKCVKLPTTATLVMVCPSCPVLGVTEVITAVAAITVNPLVIEALSPPVVTETV